MRKINDDLTFCVKMADETRELQFKVSSKFSYFLWSLDKRFLVINVLDFFFTILCFETKEEASCIHVFICKLKLIEYVMTRYAG